MISPSDANKPAGFLQPPAKSFESVSQFLFSRASLRAHVILLGSSFLTGIGLYGIHRYQTLTIEDLYQPALIWGAYWILVATVWYTGWIAWSIILSRWQKADLIATMQEDVVSYVPTFLLLGLWIKHLEMSVAFAVIPVLSGFTALKLRPFLHLIIPEGLSHKLCLGLVAVGMVVYSVTFTVLGGLRYLAFRAEGDFGIYIQQVWNFSNFDYYFLSDVGWLPFANHFSPIIFLLVPFYWIWEHPFTIIVVQNTVIALGAFPLYWMAHERLRSPVAGLAVAITYLMYPGNQYPSLGDFHESLLVGTLVLFGFYYLHKQLYRKAWLFILLVLMCKEDTPFIIFMFGVYAWIIQHQRKQGLAIIAFSVVWFIVSVWVIMPMSQGTTNWYVQFIPSETSLDASFSSLIVTLGALSDHFFSMSHLIFMLRLLIPVGALVVFAPAEFLIGVPTLLELMLYTGPPLDSIGVAFTWHVAAVVPAFFISAIFGMERLINARWFQNIAGNRSPLRLCITYFCLSSICASVSYGVHSYSVPFRTDDFQVTPHDRIGHEILKVIPPEASVSTSHLLSSHLAQRKNLHLLPVLFKTGYWLGDESLRPQHVDYVVVDTSRAALDEMPGGTAFLDEIRDIGQHPDYNTVVARDGYVVFRHKQAPVP